MPATARHTSPRETQKPTRKARNHQSAMPNYVLPKIQRGWRLQIISEACNRSRTPEQGGSSISLIFLGAGGGVGVEGERERERERGSASHMHMIH